MADLYADLRAPVISTDVASAEMIKYASNAFLATKISFINEIANVCEEVGADVGGRRPGHGPRRPHRRRTSCAPGIGYGGSCFPKDVKALKQLAGNSGYHFQLLTSVIEVNDLQKRRVVGKLERHLGSLRGTRIALLGLAFKADTDDMREASSLVLAVAAAGRGRDGGRLRPGGDANAAATARRRTSSWPGRCSRRSPAPTRPSSSPSGASSGRCARAAVREAMRTPLVVDGRNLLDPAQARAAGFAYESVGRPSAPADACAPAADADIAAR